MLMRDVDSAIFEKTKRWLEKDDSVFHLVVDEIAPLSRDHWI